MIYTAEVWGYLSCETNALSISFLSVYEKTMEKLTKSRKEGRGIFWQAGALFQFFYIILKKGRYKDTIKDFSLPENLPADTERILYITK